MGKCGNGNGKKDFVKPKIFGEFNGNKLTTKIKWNAIFKKLENVKIWEFKCRGSGGGPRINRKKSILNFE